jgi:hypothetical protein
VPTNSPAISLLERFLNMSWFPLQIKPPTFIILTQNVNSFTSLLCEISNKSIYWYCYCVVHIYVSVLLWFFRVEANLCRFFNCLFISALSFEIQLSKGEGWDPLNRFNVRGQWDNVIFPDESKLVKLFTFCVRIMKVGGFICLGIGDKPGPMHWCIVILEWIAE